MTPTEFIAALEALLGDAQKLVTDTTFLAELAAVVSAAKAIVPANTVQGFVNGAKADLARLEAIFKKK